MSRLKFTWSVAALGLSLFAPRLSSQPFVMLVDQGPQGVSTVPNGGTISMVADAIGLASTARLTFSYRGAASAVVSAIDRTGSNDFSVVLPAVPAPLTPGQSLVLTIRFVPTSGNRVTGRLTFNTTEVAPDGTQTLAAIVVSLSGAAPDLVFSYTLPNANAAPLADGGTIPFPPTPLNATASAVVTILNRGSAPGTVTSVSAAGQAFQLAGVPLPPIAIEPGRELRFTVSFTPQQREPQSGTLKVDYAGRSVAFSLQGSGASPTFVHHLLRDTSETPVLPNQTIALPDTPVGQRSTLAMRVRNSGNAEGAIQSVNVLGAGWQLSELPFLPLTLVPGAAVQFTIVFAPAQPGRAPGRLRVGNDTFELAATGLGPALEYAYAIAGTTAPVQNNGSVLFSPLQVGRTSTARFLISNTGTTAAVIGAIFVTGGTAFTLTELPEVPLTLQPGDAAAFIITFAPVAVGVSQAILRVGGNSFDLVGSGAAPTPLPAVSFEGPQGTIQPLQQPAYTLAIAESYPLNLVGTLTLAFNSEVFVDDATVQFATGGRTVRFGIPAGSTRAVFPNNETQIRLQTGSVAGAITLVPSFLTETGINLTPASPPSVSLAIPQAPPQLVSVQLGSKSAAGFTLLVTGYSTGRTLSQIELQTTAAPGATVSNPRLTLNVESAFLSWYQNVQSQQFGSLFTAVVPVSVEGTMQPGSLIDAIQSVSVTLANTLGASAARTVELR